MVVASIACCVSVVVGQGTDFEVDSDEKPVSRKKRPSFFRRPAKDTPGEQLAYARALRWEGHLRGALKQFRALVHSFHDAPEAAAAQQAYADLLSQRGRYLLAFHELQYLIDNFAGQFRYTEALEKQFEIANCVRTQRRGKFLFLPGFQDPERALPLFEKIVENAPNWNLTPQSQFFVGAIREETKKYDLAVLAYENVERRYPDSDLCSEAAFRRACCLHRISKSRPRDEVSCQDALAAFACFLRDYPQNSDAERAQINLAELREHRAAMYYERAVFYDRMARRPAAAIIAYTDFLKNCPSSKLTNKAEERIGELKTELEKKDER